MRTIAKLLVPTLAAGLLAATLPAGAATAAPVVQPELFGQHVARIASEAPDSLRGSVGAIRLWDSGITWRELQPTRNGPIDFARLQAAVNNARALGASEIMYTLGSTPEWAANSTALQPANARLALYGPGSNSHPDEGAFLAFLKAVATNVSGITSFQMWNEVNLKDFYLGTPTQMAQLTKRAKQALREVGSGAKLVAASTTMRAAGPVGKFGKAYGAAMRKAKAWGSVDAVSAHFYPPATSGPATRAAYIKKAKSYYKKFGAGKKQLWDTEMNFGDRRAYMRTKRVYSGQTAATFVARTFLDAQRYGVKRVFWYGWDIHVLGTDMTSQTSPGGAVTEGGRAYQEIRNWMLGKSWYGCKTKSSFTTCTLRGGGTKYTIRYASKTKTLKLPKGTTAYKRLLDPNPTPATAGSKISVGTQPILVIGG
jgi:polysaccharide biosynthesis protein PslG